MVVLKEKVEQSAGSLYQPLNIGQIKQITDEAFRILEKSGLAVFSDSAFSALKNAGAEVNEKNRNVRLTRSFVEDAISSNPSIVTLYSRDGKSDIEVGGGKVHCGTGGTALYVLDLDTGKRRPSVIEDLILNAKMVESLDNIDIHTINVFPHDVNDIDSIDINRFYHSLKNTNKHIMGGVYSFNGCRKVVEMAEIVAGEAGILRKKPFVSFITLIISPFRIDKHYGEMTCYFAKESLPVVVPTEPICGTTAPVTLAGNILVHVAETLGGIALVQAVRKGAPGICGSVGSIPDLNTMHHLGGAIERAMINSAVAQVFQYFKLPLYSTAGTTDAKSVNVQAAYESAMSNLLVMMSGADYIHDSAGLMESDLTVSYEKLVLDNEIIGMCRRVLHGIEVNDETLATDLIIEKGPGVDYLTEEHTIKFMRDEFFNPELANRQKREDLQNGQDALNRARDFVKAIRSEEAKNCLNKETIDRVIRRFPEIMR